MITLTLPLPYTARLSLAPYRPSPSALPPKPKGDELITLTLPLYGQALPGPLSARPLGPPDPKGGDVITLSLCGPATPASFRPSLSPPPKKT